MKKEELRYSNYYDFTGQTYSWTYKIQSLLFRNIYYYYDKRQKSWCRKIKHVPGTIIYEREKSGKVWKLFKPKHWLVNYSQVIYDLPPSKVKQSN